MSKEIWKPVVGYEGLYEVSSFGRVRSLDRELIDASGRKRRWPSYMLAPSRTNGRDKFLLQVSGLKIWKMAHSLVAESFIGPRKAGMVIDHVDGNPKNNKLSNLEYVSPRENYIRGRGVTCKKSGYPIGVSYNCGRYKASIKFGCKVFHIGNFHTPEEAGLAYKYALDHGVESARNRFLYNENRPFPIGVKPKGVKFQARITINGKRYHLGTFATKEEAGLAYESAKENWRDSLEARPKEEEAGE